MEAITKPLSIHLLGTPEIRFQGDSLRFRSRKILALLIYLVVTKQRHSRDSLIALFWPDSDPTRGRNSLRTAVSRLRQTLVPTEITIITEGNLISFDFEAAYVVDLDAVAMGYGNNATVAEWQTAVSAYRGDFLTGFSLKDAVGFDEWAAIEREACQQRIEAIFARLTRHHLDQLASAQAVQTATEWLAIAPLSEPAYQHLIEAHLLASNRSAASQTFAACAKMLDEEFGLEPSPETAALLNTSPEKMAGNGRSPTSPAKETAVFTPPFVGRGESHQKIVDRFRYATAGQTQVVLISGSAGIGKTRLVETFFNWVSVQAIETDQLNGRAFEMGGRLSYQPLIHALRQRLDAENAPDDLLPDVWLVELSRLLPELRERYPDLPKPTESNDDIAKSRLFESVALLGMALAKRQTVIFSLDDIQWADEGSLDMLQYVVHRWQESHTPIMLLLTARSEALLAGSHLNEWLHLVERNKALTRMALAPLEQTHIEQMVSQFASQSTPVQVTKQFSQWLFNESNGSPFFIEAIVWMLIEENILSPIGESGNQLDVEKGWQQIQTAVRLPLPPTIREIILARLRRLSDEDNTLLLSAAIIGRHCQFEHLCQIAGIEELSGLNSLDNLLNHSLISERAGNNPYNISHDNIRQVVYDQAGEARRRIYHRRALNVLETAASSAAELAFHALQARLYEPAFRYLIQAGDKANATFGYADAIEHYRSAYDLLMENRLANQPPQHFHDLCSRLGRAYQMNHQYAEAVQFFQEMQRLGVQIGEQALQLASLIGEATLYATSTPVQDLTISEAYATRALRLAQQLGDKAAEAKAHWLLLLHHRFAHLYPEKALAHGEASIAISREHSLRSQLAFSLNDIVQVYRELRQWDSAHKTENEARQLWLELNNLPMLADSYTSFAYWRYWYEGKLHSAMAMAQKGRQLSQEINNLYNNMAASSLMGWIYWDFGEYRQAIKYIEETIAIDKEIGFFTNLHSSLLALILADLGKSSLAIEMYKSFMNGDVAVPKWTHPVACACVTYALIINGKHEEAQQLWEPIYASIPLDDSYYYIVSYVIRAQAISLLSQSKPSEVITMLVTFLDRVDPNETCGVLVSELYYLLGRAYVELNQDEAALASLKRALAVSEKHGERRVRWRIQKLTAVLLEKQGKQEKAAKFRQEARATLDFIIEQIPEGELRASFLALPEVKDVLNWKKM